MSLTRDALDALDVFKRDKKLVFSLQKDTSITFFRDKSNKRIKISGGNEKSSIYLAMLSNQNSNNNVALKKFENNTKIFPELFIAPYVNHPNILAATLLTDNSHHYLMMPFHEHGTLSDYQHILIKEQYKNIRRYILQQMIDALIYLAEQNIQHQDLHPGNILVDKNLHIKIIDFGKADHIDPAKSIFGHFIYPDSDDLNTHKTDGYVFSTTVLEEWVNSLPDELFLSDVNHAMKFPENLSQFKNTIQPYIQLSDDEIELFFTDAKCSNTNKMSTP